MANWPREADILVHVQEQRILCRRQIYYFYYYYYYYYFFFLLALQLPMGVVFYSPLVGFSLLAYEVS